MNRIERNSKISTFLNFAFSIYSIAITKLFDKSN